MSFELRVGDRGTSALWEGRLLTSSYSAEKEAEGWAARVEARPGALVFVAGDPWGLAAAALNRRGLRAIALLPGSSARSAVPQAVETWAPEDGSLEDFLERVFDTTGPDAVLWQVWPAFERLAPEVALDWGRRFRDAYRAIQGSWLTYQHFGPRYWKNAVRNFRDWEDPATLVPGTRPLIIAASGPSLDDGLEFLARYRDEFDLWALPSSFETLVRRGIVPDAGVCTDGGFYAREHLHRLAATRVPVLAALSSAPDKVLTTRPLLFFGQGLTVERSLLGSLGGSFPEVASQGTVAVTAVKLALEATTGPVLIAGLDLCFRDLRGHTSPHTVDRRFDTRHGRTTPQEGLWAERTFEQATAWENGARTSPALITYAHWFRSRARFARRVYRIEPSNLRWDTMEEVSWQQTQEIVTKSRGRASVWNPLGSWPSARDRGVMIDRALEQLKQRAASADPFDPWLVDLARTAVPQALAEDFRAHRRGLKAGAVHDALPGFFGSLARELP